MADRTWQLIDVGKFATECGDPGLAEVVLLRSLEHSDGFYGSTSDTSLCILRNLVDFYAEQGDYHGFTKMQSRMLLEMSLRAVPE